MVVRQLGVQTLELEDGEIAKALKQELLMEQRLHNQP